MNNFETGNAICAIDLKAGNIVIEEFGETFHINDVRRWGNFIYCYGQVHTTATGLSVRIAPIFGEIIENITRIYESNKLVIIKS